MSKSSNLVVLWIWKEQVYRKHHTHYDTARSSESLSSRLDWKRVQNWYNRV